MEPNCANASGGARHSIAALAATATSPAARRRIKTTVIKAPEPAIDRARPAILQNRVNMPNAAAEGRSAVF
jgi:hypothetical protein